MIKQQLESSPVILYPIIENVDYLTLSFSTSHQTPGLEKPRKEVVFLILNA